MQRIKNYFKILVETKLPTRWGEVRIIAFGESEDIVNPYIALIFGSINNQSPVHVRIHSECFTGDVLGSQKCECGDQLELACNILATESGILIYAREEGRGIGLINKLKAYKLQYKGLNTAQANTELGFAEDLRDYQYSIDILNLLDVKNIKLLTNNPLKITALQKRGLNVERVPLEIEACEHNYSYLKTKKDHFGHLINL